MKEDLMLQAKSYLGICFLAVCTVLSLFAQQSPTSESVVPPVVKFGGVLTDGSGKPLTGTVGVTFSLYKDSEGGAALWVETQNVQTDKTGHYSVMLGSASTHGLPGDRFASGEARWFGVQAQAQVEQPRTVLMSVPYALKAADAETIGGLPPSAFLKASESRSLPSAKSNPIVAGVTGGGTTNHVTKWVGPNKLGNSNVFDGPAGNVGIATTSPTAKLDVNGGARVRGDASVNGNLSVTHIGASTLSTSTLSASSVTTGTLSATSSGETISAVMNGAGNNAAAVAGAATAGGDSGFTFGVWGTSASNQGRGVLGQAVGNASVGVLGELGSGGTGVGIEGKALPGSNGQGVWGETFAQAGANGFGPDGVDGLSHSSVGSGVFAFNDSTGDALAARNQSGGLAGDFLGDVEVDGNLSKSAGSFKIDHPLDPANKYLYHSFVESPDMMNIYNGTATTDGQGKATVQMPEWFEALNRDFRYQLTVIGQFAQAIVASEMTDRTFTIQTDKPNVKVSWQVTGIRQDAWANAHRIPVEVQKAEGDRGLYLHPEVFGASAEKSIALAHHPSMQKLQKDTAAATSTK
jgi:hypothetical protein